MREGAVRSNTYDIGLFVRQGPCGVQCGFAPTADESGTSGKNDEEGATRPPRRKTKPQVRFGWGTSGGCKKGCCGDGGHGHEGGHNKEEETTGRNHNGMFRGLMYLGDPTNDGINAVAEDWFELGVTVDSGACDTVMPAGVAKHIKVRESSRSKAGHKWEAANGSAIEDLRNIVLDEY